jgi:O-acetyl-ADP-ribose deacetylase (regulator of RNase III)
VRLCLVDRLEPLVDAWRNEFAAYPDVHIEHADILSVAHTALVSPANSYGYMNGGIDLAYRHFFGVQIEQAVQSKIKEVAGSYLPVGQAILVETGHERIPYLISAPTMFIPEPIDVESCERAMVAALKVARANPDRCSTVYCPGMGTGVGRVPPREAAAAMARAYVEAAT